MSATACAAPPCLAAAWLPLRCPARRRSHGAPGVAPCGGPPQLSGGAGVRDAAVAGEEEEEERLCRYCFEGAEAGELISPCRCMGGQKWVHLACLRRWQRTVLVSQPTHPDLYDNDTRQRVCNVCKAEFSTPPPSRQELLASFTGSELAALIEEGCVIGSAEDFSEELERQVSAFPESVRETVVCRNWIRGVFLIVKVVQDRDRHAVHLTLNEDDDRARLLVQLGNDSRTLHVRGRRFVVMPQGPLQGLEEDSPPELWRNAIGALETPVTLQLRLGPVADCGEDGIVAVNLTRPVDLSRSRPPLGPIQRLAFQAAAQRAASEPAEGAEGGLRAQVTHFVGGPCEEEQVSVCLLLSGGECTVVREPDALGSGLRLAEAAAAAREAARAAGEAAAAAALVGASPAPQKRRRAQQLPCRACRRRRAGDAEAATGEAAVAPEAAGLAPEAVSARGAAADAPVRLLVFWGYAGWSRCQLMGEIARGSWGLCRAPDDITALDHSEAWGTIYPRLVFAPRSEMSESYDGHAPEEEERRRELRRMAIFQDIIRRRPGDLPRPRGREAAEADGADGAPSESEGENLPQVWSSEAEHDEAEDEDLEEDEEVDEADVAGPEPEEMPNEDPGEWQSRWLSDDQDWLAVSE